MDSVETILPLMTEHELEQLTRANASHKQPVIFIHGLWLLPSSWDRWAKMFEEAGYAALAPRWPGDPETAAEANHDPDAFAHQTLRRVEAHFAGISRQLERKPVVIGHSFGGLLAQMLAGRGLSAATVAIDPAPFQGVLPLPASALKSAWPVLSNPLNRSRGVALTFEEFHYAFANAVSEEEAHQLYETYAVPAPGEPLFAGATANLNPWTEVKVDTKNPARGPMLIIGGEMDHTVPTAMSDAAFKLQSHNPGVTENVVMPGRGHALVIDSGWREVAETALNFVRRFA